MKKLMLLGLLLAVGCKGKTGSMGPQGTPGLNGPQQVTLSGPVSSDDFTITDARLKMSSDISVFLTDGVKLTESPYWLPGFSVNTFYLLDPNAGTIRFYNGVKAQASGYVVVFLM